MPSYEEIAADYRLWNRYANIPMTYEQFDMMGHGEKVALLYGAFGQQCA